MIKNLKNISDKFYKSPNTGNKVGYYLFNFYKDIKSNGIILFDYKNQYIPDIVFLNQLKEKVIEFKKNCNSSGKVYFNNIKRVIDIKINKVINDSYNYNYEGIKFSFNEGFIENIEFYFSGNLNIKITNFEDINFIINSIEKFIENYNNEDVQIYNTIVYNDYLESIFDNNNYKISENKITKNKSGFIYIIESGGAYKIGYTKSVENRLKQLEIGNPNKLNLVYFFKSEDIIKFEKKLHSKYKNQQIKGEWFNLTKEDIKFIKKNY